VIAAAGQRLCEANQQRRIVRQRADQRGAIECLRLGPLAALHALLGEMSPVVGGVGDLEARLALAQPRLGSSTRRFPTRRDVPPRLLRIPGSTSISR